MKRPLIALMAFLLWGCPRSDDKPTAPVDEHAGHVMPTATPTAPMAHLNERQMALANVQTAVAKRRLLTSEIPAAGRIAVDETRMTRLTAWVDGRIDRLRVAASGAYIRKGQPIADIYSPDLVSAQQELLLAVQSAKELEGATIPGIREDALRLVEASKRRLSQWGLTTAEINAVIRHQKPHQTVPILAQASGIVMQKMVQAGDWVDKGMVLYELADLSRVWAEADIYEYELTGVRVGQTVRVETVAYPGEIFLGRVAFVHPMLNDKSRTNTVRIELANPGGRLKPDMFATVTLTVQHGERLVVPPAAVLDTGRRQMVWVEHDPGKFVARTVRTGLQTEDGWEILQGLEAGERIAVSGGFMLDASTQLESSGDHAGH